MMLVDFSSVSIRSSNLIIDTVKVINNGRIKAAIITDEEERLLGLVADGDIRRALLRGVQMHEPVAHIMNKTPKTLTVGYSPQQAEEMLKNSHIVQIPGC